MRLFLHKCLKAVSAGLTLVLLLPFVFPAVEPVIVEAVEETFEIRQTVTSEISFYSAVSDVTMSGSIPGLTGGSAYGSTTVIVLTNENTGYTMTIKASSSPAMVGNQYSGTIPDYTPAEAGIPDYAFTNPGSGGEFGYTVTASTTGDLAQKFKDNGSSACNTGSSDTSGSASCWYGLSTTATSTNVRSSATAASGSTSTIVFRVRIMPSSSYTEDTYTATTTLTATAN